MRDDAPKALEKMTEAQLRARVVELALECDLYESLGRQVHRRHARGLRADEGRAQRPEEGRAEAARPRS